MYLNVFTLCFLAAATARTIPEYSDSRLAPPPTDFPRRPPLRQAPESRGTGVICDQDNGDAVEKKPNFDEFRNGNEQRNRDDRRQVYQEQPKYFDDFKPGNYGSQDNSGPDLQGKSNSDGFAIDDNQDGYKIAQENPPRGRNFDNFDNRSSEENKPYNFIQKSYKVDKNVTGKRDSQSVNVSFIDYQISNENLDDRFDNPKTNINNTNSKTSDENEVLLERRTIDSNLPGNVSDDRWIWSDTTTVIPTDLDNRAAFDGGKCPTGKVRIKGSDMCVDKDED